jgi:hypothetical protein
MLEKRISSALLHDALGTKCLELVL